MKEVGSAEGWRADVWRWLARWPQWSPENRPKAVTAKPANGALSQDKFVYSLFLPNSARDLLV